jgi:aminopeptidase C
MKQKLTVSNAAKLKAIVTILNATNENINRKLKLNQNANVDRLYEERDELQTEIEILEALIVEDPPKTPRTRKQPKRSLLERALLEKK